MMTVVLGAAMAVVSSARVSAMTKIGVSSVLARGSGTLQLDRRYALGDLIYTGSTLGRGVVSLQAGSGRVRLSGADAEHPSAGSYILHVDRLDVASTRSVTSVCTLTMSTDQRTYRTLSCAGSIPATAEKFVLSWRGDGRQAEPVAP